MVEEMIKYFKVWFKENFEEWCKNNNVDLETLLKGFINKPLVRDDKSY